MKIHVFQHDACEGPGALAAWAAARGHAIRTTLLPRGGEIPAGLDGADWLVVLGGEMNVHETGRHPWLVDEKRAIEHAIGAGRTVLGICLGSQLLADVLGAPVRRNREREIGWFPVRMTEEGARIPLFGAFPAEAEVLHWHGDTWDLPAGAVRAMESGACPSQAFVYGDRVVGLQFHPEMTPETAAALAAEDAEVLAAGGAYVQPADELLRDGGRFARANRWLWRMLDRLEGRGGEAESR